MSYKLTNYLNFVHFLEVAKQDKLNVYMQIALKKRCEYNLSPAVNSQFSNDKFTMVFTKRKNQ